MKSFKETGKEKLGLVEDKLNSKIKDSNFSWGLILLIAAALYAFYRLIRFIFFFFS